MAPQYFLEDMKILVQFSDTYATEPPTNKVITWLKIQSTSPIYF